MSWGFSVSPAVAAEKAAEAIAAAEPSPVVEGEAADQVAAAKDAAIKLLPCVAPGGTHVFVSASGHANPGHKPTEGWGNDSISLQISQVPEPAE